MSVTLLTGDARDLAAKLDDNSVQTIITSPPYYLARKYDGPDAVYSDWGNLGGPHEHRWLPNGCCEWPPPDCYAWKGQLGQEPTPIMYANHIVEVFRALKPKLRDDGTFWLNLGDTRVGSGYSNHRGTGGVRKEDGGRQKHVSAPGYPNKSLLGMPWRVALALQDEGWILRSDIIWHKIHPQPESVTDRPAREHEYVFLFSKGRTYQYHWEALSVLKADLLGRKNRGDVWQIPAKSRVEGHTAAMPWELAYDCIRASTSRGELVLDPFGGSGTTARVASMHGREAISIDISAAYSTRAAERIFGKQEPVDERSA